MIRVDETRAAATLVNTGSVLVHCVQLLKVDAARVLDRFCQIGGHILAATVTLVIQMGLVDRYALGMNNFLLLSLSCLVAVIVEELVIEAIMS